MTLESEQPIGRELIIRDLEESPFKLTFPRYRGGLITIHPEAYRDITQTAEPTQLSIKSAETLVSLAEGREQSLGLTSGSLWQRLRQLSQVFQVAGSARERLAALRRISQALVQRGFSDFISDSRRLVEEGRAERPRRPNPKDEWGLTKRQADILTLAAQGKTGQQIADALGISWGTVKNIISQSILRKLGTADTVQAVIKLAREEHPSFRQTLLELQQKLHSGTIDPFISPREMDVWRLISQGRSEREIAQDLGIKWQTVKNHKTNLLKKLPVSRSIQAALLYLLHKGEISIPPELAN